jgi:DNA-binding NarL/FixJ family response regulator
MIPPAAQRQNTILVIDDEPNALRFLTDALEGAGFRILVATSGLSAIERLAHVAPDLILIDAVMPGLDGFETTSRIKADSASAHIPVIFMTGLTDSEHVVSAFKAGCADYVRKPVNVDELLARVRAHIANGRMVQASLGGLDATGRLVLATDSAGRFLWCTPLAEQVIARVAAGWCKDAVELPGLLQNAVARLLSMRGSANPSVKLEHPTITLELTLIAQHRDNEILIRFAEIDPQADAAKLRRSFSLTPREAEVLLWISYGKPNRVISDILSISPRTVHKHSERIFEKLGIENRSAAAAVAIRSITQ